MTLEKPEKQLKELYSHTSSVWNSAVTLTMAGIALSAAAMFSAPFNSLIFEYRVILSIIFYFTIEYFGFFRIIEISNQLMFLETEIMVEKDLSLFEYISGKDGKTGNFPRNISVFFGRMTLEEAKALRGAHSRLPKFRKQHLIGIVSLAIFYIAILVGLEYFKIVPF
jgi:hypothetical protein